MICICDPDPYTSSYGINIIKPVPVLLFGKEYWQRIINFEALVDEGTIDPHDLKLFKYVETAQQAWEFLHINISECN